MSKPKQKQMSKCMYNQKQIKTKAGFQTYSPNNDSKPNRIRISMLVSLVK